MRQIVMSSLSGRLHLFVGALVVCCTLLLTGCSPFTGLFDRHTPPARPPRPAGGPANASVPVTGCGRSMPTMPGSSINLTINVNPALARGNATRMYIVHVPSGYRQNQALPLVLAFHGHGGNAGEMERVTGFSQLADGQNFIVVYPQGLLEGDSGLTFWATGAVDYGVDDVQYVSGVLDDVEQRLCVDTHRIYAAGFSNGGGMTGLLACRLSGRIAAFAAVSGQFFFPVGGCHPGRAVPVLEVHGTADRIVPYMGVPASQDPVRPLPTIPDWLRDWATRDNCSARPVVFLQTLAVIGEQWMGCQGNTTVIHYRMENGDHVWPDTLGDQPGSTAIWNFLQSHPLPTS